MNRICFVDDVGTLCFLPEKDYAKKENWDVIRQSVVDRYSDLYSYLVAHRSDFVKSVGERTVNTLLERLYIPDLMDYACGKKEYDAGQLLALSTDMQKAEIPDASMCYLLYDIAKLRGTKKYPELIELMKTRGRELEGRRLPVELSFEFPELSKSERELIGGFLKEEAGRESEGSNSKKYLSALAQHILVGQEAGISFDVHTFAEAMEKAKAENKLVFMDCYTTWCGPCRMMASQVFTQQKVGDMLENLHIDGVIGYNLLKLGILKLDARTGSMTFTNYDGGLGIDYTRAIPMLPDSYLTLLRVQLKDGACDTVMFDSGAKSFYELSMKSFSNLRTAGKALEVKGAGQGVLSLGAAGLEGKSQKYRVVIPQFKLGNFLFEEVTSVTTDAVDSRIGSDLLRYGTVIADYRSNVFYFIPYDNRKKLNLYEKDWDVVITVMDDHLCAGLVWDYAGLPLHGGERIVAVNGVRYDKVDLYEAITKGLIHLPGDKARIVYIGEDGKEHEVTIRKR